MNSAELIKSLLKNDDWKKLYETWLELSPDKKSFEHFTAMCIGKAARWFNSFLSDPTHQYKQVEWVAGALTKLLKENNAGV